VLGAIGSTWKLEKSNVDSSGSVDNVPRNKKNI
jgi:hypothetical protein